MAYIKEKNKMNLSGNEKYVNLNFLRKNIEWLPLKNSFFSDDELDEYDIEVRDSTKILDIVFDIKNALKKIGENNIFNK